MAAYVTYKQVITAHDRLQNIQDAWDGKWLPFPERIAFPVFNNALSYILVPIAEGDAVIIDFPVKRF